MGTLQMAPLQLLRGLRRGSCRPALLLSAGRPAASAPRWFSSDSSSSFNAATAARTLKLLERRKVSTMDLGILKRKAKPITMVTAYDYPSAVHVDLAGFDVLLVGDSLGMVELVLRTIVNGGIAVMGHIGLRPQHISVLGGFRAQGRTGRRCFCFQQCRGAQQLADFSWWLPIFVAVQAKSIIEDALAVQEAGAFAVVLECVPSPVAKHVTQLLKIPTIGIGAGPETDGQVLVYHDLLGMLQHPHHAQFVPKFCKRYADVGEQIRIGLENYRDDVENGRFSSDAYSPYKMSKEETQKLHDIVAAEYSDEQSAEKEDATPSEVTKVY
ncbi:hypothetical protein BBJ28_00007908 [Nothophytophthora sp. Chile5]|nr:hypothetical protein BBJ28_00007908 [Nothophytophthora sp. Chile5]